MRVLIRLLRIFGLFLIAFEYIYPIFGGSGGIFQNAEIYVNILLAILDKITSLIALADLHIINAAGDAKLLQIAVTAFLQLPIGLAGVLVELCGIIRA